MKVLMIGPDTKLVPGGMSSVVKNYLNSELFYRANITYLPTNIEAKITEKIYFTLKSYIKYIKYINKNDIIHIHMAERGSFYRKSIFILIGKLLNKKIIVHFHGAEFDKFYNDECNSINRKYINYILNKVDINIALGEEWKDKIEKYSDTKVIVLNNAVYTQENNMYCNDVRAFRRKKRNF